MSAVWVALFMSNGSGRVGYGIKLVLLSDPRLGVLLILRVTVYQTGLVQDSALYNSTAKETRRHNRGFKETDLVFFPDSRETEPQMFLCLIMAAIE